MRLVLDVEFADVEFALVEVVARLLRAELMRDVTVDLVHRDDPEALRNRRRDAMEQFTQALRVRPTDVAGQD